MLRIASLAAALVAVAAPAPALAWGAMGHRMVGELAMQALPAQAPAFLRTPQAVRDVGELSREQDRSKGAGRLHDTNRDSGHFIDLDEDDKLLAGPPLAPLPATRADYEKALQAFGLDSWKAGYLQFSIVDQQQQLTQDFGYWRVLMAAIPREKNKVRRAWLARDLVRRETQILATIGHLSHFIGDGSQPLHTSTHYNGWGDYPNPNGYTTAKIHNMFEGEFVVGNIRAPMISAKLTPLRSCNCPIEQRTAEYLSTTGKQVIPFYELEKAGGFAPGDARGIAFTSDRLAAGASELRDVIMDAWKMSATTKVGWPTIKVEDAVAGRADPYIPLYGKD